MTKTIRRNLFKAAALIGAAVLAAGPALAKERLVLGTIQGPTSPLTRAAEHFGAELDRLTEGRYVVNVVSAAQLGPALEQYRTFRTVRKICFLMTSCLLYTSPSPRD